MSRTPKNARLGGGALALLGLAAAVAPALGQPSTPPAGPPQTQTQNQSQTQPQSEYADVIVHFKDGRRINGELIRENAAEVVVRFAGIDTTLNTGDILRIDRLPPIEEHYRRLRAVIADNDIEQLLVLTDWLRDRGAYHLALQELVHILEVDPSNAQAQTLRLLVESQIKLRLESSQRERTPAAADNPGAERPRRPVFPTLTDDQINLLKVYEVDLGDPPRMSVERETVQALIAAYEGNELIPLSREGRTALERRPADRILDLMFRLKARDFYGQVQVQGEPQSFRLFRENVHRAWLINSCATNACHGGQQAGRLWLNNENQNSERTLYTNFLILDRYRLADGTPLINYEAPADSPLLHMALPREESLYPHPLVATSRTSAWRAVIGSVDDRRFTEAIEWINAMYRPRPEYPITYVPPQPADGVPPLPAGPAVER